MIKTTFTTRSNPCCSLAILIGEIGEKDKPEFLGNAHALLFPIDWPEPFGLVMIEALACGTPVIAWRNGSVPEVIEDGVTGFLVEDLDGAVRAVERVAGLSRRECRRAFERRFTAARMAENYLRVYRRLVRRAAAPRVGDGRLRQPAAGLANGNPVGNGRRSGARATARGR